MSSFETYIELCGKEFAVIAEFTIHSFGTPDSYFEPGDPAEIEIDAVYYRDDPTGRDISKMLSGMRDLSTPIMSGEYGYGFKLQHGTFIAQCGQDFRLYAKHYKPKLTFNENRSLLDVIEMDIYDNLNEYESEDHPAWD